MKILDLRLSVNKIALLSYHLLLLVYFVDFTLCSVETSCVNAAPEFLYGRVFHCWMCLDVEWDQVTFLEGALE